MPRNRQGPKASFNVKVGIRIRPFSEKEKLKNPTNREFVMTNGNNVFVNDKSFNYDHVFTAETEQEEVFKQVAKPQLDSLLEGTGFEKSRKFLHTALYCISYTHHLRPLVNGRMSSEYDCLFLNP